jgi:site-specific DNA-methyltransferase (adenine-specific)
MLRTGVARAREWHYSAFMDGIPPASASRVRNGKREGHRPPVVVSPVSEVMQTQDQMVRVHVGDCREVLPMIPEVAAGKVDLVFADPPFNWNRAYDAWNDQMEDEEYLKFTYDWLNLCIGALKPTGSLWVNIPDDWAAEIVTFLKGRGPVAPAHPMHMVNWCVWHYRFGQNRIGAFVSSKVHVLYFSRDPKKRTWNPTAVLEPSDRATTYFDPRTLSKKDGMPAGMRVPLDVWYGPFWGRVQGNNKERRDYHDNQLPEAYLERVILCSSNPGDLVLDPFTGSGTTPTVARAYGRRFVGTEFSPQNARNAVARAERGMVGKGRALGQATAIFSPRPAGEKARAKFSKKKDA